MTQQIASQFKRPAFAALYHPSFRFFFFGTMLAMMAGNMEHVVSYWLLFQKFHSPTLAGFADISHWTPFLLLSVYFGGIADRYHCRKIIQTAQVLYYMHLTVWLMYVRYTGHLRGGAVNKRASRWNDAITMFREVASNRSIVTMIILGGAASLLVGNAVQTQMPAFATDLGSGEAG